MFITSKRRRMSSRRRLAGIFRENSISMHQIEPFGPKRKVDTRNQNSEKTVEEKNVVSGS